MFDYIRKKVGLKTNEEKYQEAVSADNTEPFSNLPNDPSLKAELESLTKSIIEHSVEKKSYKCLQIFLDAKIGDANLYSRLLFKAIKQDDLITIKKLLDAGADINYTNVNDLHPLGYALSLGKVETIRELIAAGADVADRYTSQGSTIFGQSLWMNDLGLVKALTESNPKITPEFLSKELSGMFFLRKGEVHLGIIQYIIDSGADIKKHENSIIYYAVNDGDRFTNRCELLKKLLENGLNLKNSALMLSGPISLKDREFFDLILAQKPCQETLDNALSKMAMGANLMFLDDILDAGADPNTTTPFVVEEGDGHFEPDRTEPQHILIKASDNTELFRKLLERGADPNALSHFGQPVLSYAIENNLEDAVRELIRAEAKVAGLGKNFLTPLQYAVRSEKSSTYVELLMAAGAPFEESALLVAKNNKDEQSIHTLEEAKQGRRPSLSDVGISTFWQDRVITRILEKDERGDKGENLFV